MAKSYTITIQDHHPEDRPSYFTAHVCRVQQYVGRRAGYGTGPTAAAAARASIDNLFEVSEKVGKPYA